MIKYKVLQDDLRSPFYDMQYKIGREYRCVEFDTDFFKDCSHGYYATDIEGLTYSYRPGSRIFECEVGGRNVILNPFKQRFETIKLLREIAKEGIISLIRQTDLKEKLGYDIGRAIFSKNPLYGGPSIVTNDAILLLEKWASVGASVGASVWASVGDSVWAPVWASVGASVGASVWASVWASVGASVWASVWASVRASVWASVRASVRASVWAYISSIFFKISDWKYFDHKEGENPFQSGIDLWESGFVPSFDGEVWRLHSGVNAEIVYTC